MKGLPRRTTATSLTDDELILFDVMFDGGAPFQLLRRETFRRQWNYQSHGLTDDQLQKTLTRLVDAGLLTTERHCNRTHFQVTANGGQQWELERLPVWHRYATERYSEAVTRKPIVTITAPSAQFRDDFWRVGCDAGFFTYTNGRIKTATIENHVLIPWKSFPNLHVVVAVLDELSHSVDWRAFETGRTWWRTVQEGDKFWENSL